MSCGSFYKSKPESLGVTKWKLRSGSSHTKQGYCAAESCNEPLYILDSTTGYCKLNVCQSGEYFDEDLGGNGECVECGVDTYCDGNNPTGQPARTIVEHGGKWYPEKKNCPTHTTSSNGSTTLSNCTATEGYYFDPNSQTTATICPSGTYCPTNSTEPTNCPPNTVSPAGSSVKNQCEAKPGFFGTAGQAATICTPGYYCQGGGNRTQCPTNTHSLQGSDNKNDCIAKAGYHGPPGSNPQMCLAGTYCPGGQDYASCHADTTSPAGSFTYTDCKPKSGYYGGNGITESVNKCPGMEIDTDSTYHSITTTSVGNANKQIGDCVYDTCPDGYYRHNDGRCTEFSNITSTDCESEEIFVQGRQSGGLSTYAEYSPGLEANYDNNSIYGHDNLCMPISQICSA